MPYSLAAVRFTCPFFVTKSSSPNLPISSLLAQSMLTAVSPSARPAIRPVSRLPRSLRRIVSGILAISSMKQLPRFVKMYSDSSVAVWIVCTSSPLMPGCWRNLSTMRGLMRRSWPSRRRRIAVSSAAGLLSTTGSLALSSSMSCVRRSSPNFSRISLISARMTPISFFSLFRMPSRRLIVLRIASYSLRSASISRPVRRCRRMSRIACA